MPEFVKVDESWLNKASGLPDDSSQFCVESMLALVNLKPLFKKKFCLLSSGEQFGMLITLNGGENGAGKTLEAVLQFCDALYDFGRRNLRLDVGIERDFAFDLLDVFGNRGFTVIYRMNDLGEDTREFVLVGHSATLAR